MRWTVCGWPAAKPAQLTIIMFDEPLCHLWFMWNVMERMCANGLDGRRHCAFIKCNKQELGLEKECTQLWTSNPNLNECRIGRSNGRNNAFNWSALWPTPSFVPGIWLPLFMIASDGMNWKRGNNWQPHHQKAIKTKKQKSRQNSNHHDSRPHPNQKCVLVVASCCCGIARERKESVLHIDPCWGHKFM